jgi:plastocyanin
MPRRRLFRALALVPVVGAIAAVPALAASSSPSKATLHTVGKTTFKVNQYIQDGSHFDLNVVKIKSGGTLTIADRSGEDHTFSLVAKKDVPKTLNQIGNCNICNQIAADHGVTGENTPPTTLVVDKGKAGFDEAGDSAVVPARKKVKVKITAAKGTTLHYICIIHPWMQGTVQVG